MSTPNQKAADQLDEHHDRVRELDFQVPLWGAIGNWSRGNVEEKMTQVPIIHGLIVALLRSTDAKAEARGRVKGLRKAAALALGKAAAVFAATPVGRDRMVAERPLASLAEELEALASRVEENTK